jgi:hypothetical protein
MSEGIGTAAKTVMEITSFLFPDDIPKELINVGIVYFDLVMHHMVMELMLRRSSPSV